MKKTLILLWFITVAAITYAQPFTEKRFYDNYNRLTADSTKAFSYAVITFTDSTKKAGIKKVWTLDGKLKSITSLSDIASYECNGWEFVYHDNGQLKSQAWYNKGKLDGELLTCYATGVIKRQDIYQNDSLISGHCFTPAGKDTIWFKYISPAEYEGGLWAISRFVNAKMKYPKEAEKNEIQGTVYIQFIIDANGNISEEKIVSNTHRLLNEEAMRLFKLLPPTWKTRKVDGEPVPWHARLPLMFKLFY